MIPGKPMEWEVDEETGEETPKDKDCVGQYASIPGRQTVPRAEMYALIILFRFLTTLESGGLLNVYTDNKAVYDGFVARKRPATDHINILWEEVWLLWNQVREQGWVVVLFKVKGHANAGHVLEGLIIPQLLATTTQVTTTNAGHVTPTSKCIIYHDCDGCESYYYR